MTDQKKKSTEEMVGDFMSYVAKHPELRFWQALRNWSEYEFIYASKDLVDDKRLKDTFYKENE